MLEDGIAYVDINTFGDKTTQELRAALQNLMKQNPKGMIIDLRNNPWRIFEYRYRSLFGIH